MRWTFDPLQSRNAYVNLAKLGIVTREYVQDMYGETGSPLHRGVGTDRLVALWEMDSERVTRRLRGGGPLPPVAAPGALPRVIPVKVGESRPSPGRPLLELDDPELLLSIPADIDTIVAEDVALAVRWREATRMAFLHYLGRGYLATELIPDGRVSHYLLTR
jgi:predicted GNAT superfamily acetyltransferase